MCYELRCEYNVFDEKNQNAIPNSIRDQKIHLLKYIKLVYFGENKAHNKRGKMDTTKYTFHQILITSI